MKVVSKTRKSASLFRVIAEKNLYPMLKEMGNPVKVIDKYQRTRVIQSIMIGLFFLVLGLIFSSMFYLGALLVSILFYKSRYKAILRKYEHWKFERHLHFSKFTRLLIPYLKESKGNVSLYSIFNRILQRLDNEADKKSLYTLMSEMSSKPDDITPFVEYAERSSGTDMSILFMSTIFDFKQSSFDTSVIDELGRIASEELINGIDEIIHVKLRRFVFFPTKLVMSSFILVVGFALAILVANLSQIQL